MSPTYQEIADSQLSMIVASTADAIMMVEAGSDEVPEEIILECISRAHEANLASIGMIET